MNNRHAVGALYASPSVLLDRLGIHMVLLYRPRARKWQWLLVEQLDEEIWQYGEALLFRWSADGQASIIRLAHPLLCLLSEQQYPAYALVSVRPDYVGEGRKFLLSLLDERSGKRRYYPVWALSTLTRVPYTERDAVLPWPF